MVETEEKEAAFCEHYTVDDVIDVGAAAALIFPSLVRLAREDISTVELLYTVAVMLKLYISTCVCNDSSDRASVVSHIVGYITAILDQVHGSRSPYYVEHVELSVICLGFEIAEKLGRGRDEEAVGTMLAGYFVSSPPILSLLVRVLKGSPAQERGVEVMNALYGISAPLSRKLIREISGMTFNENSIAVYPSEHVPFLWIGMAKAQGCEVHIDVLQIAIDEIREARSHTEFLGGLASLSRLALRKNFGDYFVRKGVLDVVGR